MVRSIVKRAQCVRMPGIPGSRPPHARIIGPCMNPSATGAAVLFPAESDPPSAYWAVTPEGRFTRARLLVSDEDHIYSVDAVEDYVAQLPSAEVTLIPVDSAISR